MTGFGRFGHGFASEAVFGIQPDIITSAKGITSGYVPLVRLRFHLLMTPGFVCGCPEEHRVHPST